MKRPWIKLDAAFMDDPKVIDAGEQAAYLYLAVLCKSALLRSDGVLTEGQMARLGISDWQARSEALLRAGLLLYVDGTYRVPNWDGWQKTQAQYAQEAEKKRVRRMSAGRPQDIRKMSATRQEKTRKEVLAPVDLEANPPAGPEAIATILREAGLRAVP